MKKIVLPEDIPAEYKTEFSFYGYQKFDEKVYIICLPSFLTVWKTQNEKLIAQAHTCEAYAIREKNKAQELKRVISEKEQNEVLFVLDYSLFDDEDRHEFAHAGIIRYLKLKEEMNENVEA